MLYLTGYSKTDIKNLDDLRATIKDYQENNVLKSTVNAGLVELNGKIDDKMNEISAMAIGRQTQNMAVAEAELRSLMQQRKDYMRQITNEDETLKRYYSNEESLVNKINQTLKTVKSPADGLVSYYLDGYETVLTVNSIPDMTPAKMKKLRDEISKKSKAFSSSLVVEANQPICRIVNPAKWYAVIVLGSRENPFVEGMEYPLTFGGMQGTVSGRAIKVTSAGGSDLIVLEISEGAANMMSVRIVNGHVGSDLSGFRVPVGMLKQDGGKLYIAVKGTDGNVRRIEVELLGKDDKYAIIGDVTGASELTSGVALVKP
jgi:putative membrane fusion protein